MAPMKYSLFTLSVPECTPVEAAKIIKEAGYDGVEWRCTEQPETLSLIPDFWASNRATLDVKKWKSVVPEFRKITSDHGLECSNLGCYCRVPDFEGIKVSIEIARALGCPRLRVSCPGYDGKTNYWDLLKRTRDDYARAAELCRDAGLQGLMELHAGILGPSASGAFRIVEGLDPKHMGVMFDPGNMVVEGFEPWKMGCEILGSHLAYCHAKNMRLRVSGVTESGGLKWDQEACEMHAGFVDWLAVFKAFHAVGYNGWVSNEDHFMSRGGPLERIRNGLLHLKRCEEIAARA